MQKTLEKLLALAPPSGDWELGASPTPADLGFDASVAVASCRAANTLAVAVASSHQAKEPKKLRRRTQFNERGRYLITTK